VRGFRDAHRQHGLAVVEELLVGEQFGQRNGYLEVKRLIENDHPPSAIFALSHLVTLEALRALKDHDLRIPEDVSLLGFDALPHAEFFATPITTLNQPIQEMGTLAMDLLVGQMDKPERTPAMSVQLPCTLVRRDSVSIHQLETLDPRPSAKPVPA
jgi:LacI family transcriptional regulator